MGKGTSEWGASGQLGLNGMSALCSACYDWAQEQLSFPCILPRSPKWDAVYPYSSVLILSSHGAKGRRRELLSQES